MYRVIIADDEPWSIFGLKTLIDWESHGFTIVATMSDGLSTLDAVRQHKPDLLISDIRMPGLDGLQLTRAMKEEKLDTAVVLVTGYSDFAYAQEALRQGVFDYLVKQVRRTELFATLERVRAHLDKKNAVPDWNTYFSILSDDAQLTCADCFGLLHLRPSSSCCVLTRLYNRAVDSPMISSLTCDGGAPGVRLRVGKRKEIVLLSDENVAYVPAAGDSFVQGSSGFESSAEPISILHRRSEIALLTALSRHTPACVYQADSTDSLNSTISAFAIALRGGDQKVLLTRLQEVRSLCLSMQFDTALTAANRLTALLQESRFGAWEALESRHDLLFDTDPLEELFEPILRCITAEQNSQPVAPSQIHQILDVLDDMFTQDIRIDDLARRFFLSANYLSILIKRETGQTFTELLILKRIAMAKKLLMQTNLPIQEVVEQVGYKEYSTFIKLFKKHTGTTPHVYRVESRKSAEARPAQ